MIAGAVLVVPVRLREVNHVEPVPSPSLAVGRRREQPIDELFVSDGGDGSATNASTSAIEEQSPSRLTVTRRIGGVRRGERSEPFATSLEPMNRSIGVRSFSKARGGTVGETSG